MCLVNDAFQPAFEPFCPHLFNFFRILRIESAFLVFRKDVSLAALHPCLHVFVSYMQNPSAGGLPTFPVVSIFGKLTVGMKTRLQTKIFEVRAKPLRQNFSG